MKGIYIGENMLYIYDSSRIENHHTELGNKHYLPLSGLFSMIIAIITIIAVSFVYISCSPHGYIDIRRNWNDVNRSWNNSYNEANPPFPIPIQYSSLYNSNQAIKEIVDLILWLGPFICAFGIEMGLVSLKQYGVNKLYGNIGLIGNIISLIFSISLILTNVTHLPVIE